MPDTQEQLLVDYLPLIRRHARRVEAQTRSMIHADDLVQEICVHMLKYQNYDPSRATYGAYVIQSVRCVVQRYFQKERRGGMTLGTGTKGVEATEPEPFTPKITNTLFDKSLSPLERCMLDHLRRDIEQAAAAYPGMSLDVEFGGGARSRELAKLRPALKGWH